MCVVDRDIVRLVARRGLGDARVDATEAGLRSDGHRPGAHLIVRRHARDAAHVAPVRVLRALRAVGQRALEVRVAVECAADPPFCVAASVEDVFVRVGLEPLVHGAAVVSVIGGIRQHEVIRATEGV